jgi:hypothetical protein
VTSGPLPFFKSTAVERNKDDLIAAVSLQRRVGHDNARSIRGFDSKWTKNNVKPVQKVLVQTLEKTDALP